MRRARVPTLKRLDIKDLEEEFQTELLHNEMPGPDAPDYEYQESTVLRIVSFRSKSTISRPADLSPGRQKTTDSYMTMGSSAPTFFKKPSRRTALKRSLTEQDLHTRLSVELRHRFLTAMRASYHHQFDEGLLRQSTVQILLEATECALDAGNLSAAYDQIQPYFETPTWLRYMIQSDWHWIRDLGRSMLSDHMTFGVELATAFTMASEKVGKVINNEFPELSTGTWADIVQKEHAKLDRRVKDFLHDLQVSYPDAYREIKTNHASCYMLHNQLNSVEALYRDGILESKEYNKLKELLWKYINRATAKQVPIQKTTFSSFDQGFPTFLVSQLGFMEHLTSECRAELIASTSHKVIDYGQVLSSPDNPSRGVYVILSGIIAIELDESTYRK